MFDKQEVKFVIKNQEAFAFLLAVLCILKTDEDTQQFVLEKIAWYIHESKDGKEPVRIKMRMTFEEFVTLLYGSEKKRITQKFSAKTEYSFLDKRLKVLFLQGLFFFQNEKIPGWNFLENISTRNLHITL